MKNKLKTLNDLRKEKWYCGSCGRKELRNLPCDELRKEAIKWYKEIFQYGEDHEEFRKFFNITKEDLG